MKIADIADQLISISMGMKEISENLIIELQQLKKDDWEALWNYAGQQQVWGIIYEALIKLPQTVKPDKDVITSFLKMRENLLYQYYSMLSFTTMITDILQKSNIGFYVLKGVGLDSLYLSEGIRPISDVDIYIPGRKQFEKACQILEINGFQSEKEMWDYHKVYYLEREKQREILEMHIRLAGRMSADSVTEHSIMDEFDKLPYQPEFYSPSGIKVPVLVPKQYALHLLLHMMNHFLGGELRLNMLCDWVAFWNKKGEEIDSKSFTDILKKAGLEKFAIIITGLCLEMFGLSLERVKWMSEYHRMYQEEKNLKIWIDQDVQRVERKKIVNVIIDPQKPLPMECFREVNRQMKYRFPKLQKLYILRPFLWAGTIMIFFINSWTQRRKNIGDIICDAKKRSELTKQMGLMERGKR